MGAVTSNPSSSGSAATSGAATGAAAAIGVAPGNVGAGTSDALAGYDVTNTEYEIVDSEVTGINFDITNGPGFVDVHTSADTYSDWTCTLGTPPAVECDPVASGPDAENVDSISVAATN